MADNQESLQNAGSGAQPNATPSGSEGASPSGTGAQAQGLETLQEQLKRMAGEINALKSGKDKAVSQVRKDVEDVREKLARYEKLRSKDMSPDEAMDEVLSGATIQDEIRELREQMRTLVERGGIGSSASGTPTAAQAFSSVGLDPADPDVAIAISEAEGKSPAEMKLAAYELRERKSKQPTPTRAQGSSIAENTPPAPNLEGLRKEYEQEVRKFHGNAGAIAQLKEGYRKRGLAVW